ncbi:MAG: fatty acid desaturase [Cyclobacteriaceae bacterium]
MLKTIKFASNQNDFFSTLNQRVNEYFKQTGKSKHANGEMVFKTVFMFLLYFVPYGFMITGSFSNVWIYFLLCLIMGLGVAGIGLSVMHDANHGAYSNKPWINNLLGFSLNMIGGHAFNWRVQHNVLHHTYTNIHDVDEDISPRGIIRMCPDSKWLPVHRFQHWYAWLLYGLMTFVWVVSKDYMRLVKYEKDGLVKKQKSTAVREWTLLITSKVLYLGYTLVLPMVILPLSAWTVLLGFFIMHYVAGFILAIIFQPAHVIEGTHYPQLKDGISVENNWAVHQLQTTTNFANKSVLFSWYVGGLNFQVEHHLFPTICHVHYKSIAPIVEKTAKEFGFPYKSKTTFLDALVAHGKMMKELGRKPSPQMQVATA